MMNNRKCFVSDDIEKYSYMQLIIVYKNLAVIIDYMDYSMIDYCNFFKIL